MPRFITKTRVEVIDQYGRIYNSKKQVRFKISMLQSGWCDYTDAYLVVKGTITVTEASNRDMKKRFSTFKNNGPFTTCMSKFNNVLIDNAED